ncbi:MarR family winged helix-turn-helix transcriptional regulator [Salinifilum ghardaiensis]
MELDQAVFHFLRRALQEHAADWQARLSLTKPQYAVLTAIHANPGIEQTALGQRAAIDKATLASLLVRLESRGLVRRAVDDEDRRRRLLELTEQGERELRAAAPVADAIDAEMLRRLAPEERGELLRLLGKLTAGDEPEQ